MAPPTIVPAVLSLATFILDFLLTLPAFYSISRCVYFGRKDQKNISIAGPYEDEDGVATDEAKATYSATVPKYLALASTLLGFAVNIITSVYTVIQPKTPSHLEHWFTFGSWVGRCSWLLQCY